MPDILLGTEAVTAINRKDCVIIGVAVSKGQRHVHILCPGRLGSVNIWKCIRATENHGCKGAVSSCRVFKKVLFNKVPLEEEPEEVQEEKQHKQRPWGRRMQGYWGRGREEPWTREQDDDERRESSQEQFTQGHVDHVEDLGFYAKWPGSRWETEQEWPNGSMF